MPKQGVAMWPRKMRYVLRSAFRGGSRYFFGRRGQRRIQGLRLYYRMQALFVMRTGGSLRSLVRDREVRVWIDGFDVFRRLETLIGRAHVSIVIQMFIWKNDETGRRVARWLIDAADRGVTVDIMKEAVGDFFETYRDFLGTKSSDDPLWKTFWNHPRIKVVHATHRDHAKVYVIDGHTVLLTGMNIADEYRYDWHDCMVELRGSSFAEQFLTRKPPSGEKFPVRLVMNTEEQKDIRATFLSLLDSAREHVIIEHAYFSDSEVISKLVSLSKRGVQITAIIPGRMEFHNKANLQAMARLMTEGSETHVRVFVYRGFCHSKVLMVDGTAAFLGSANLYKGSLDDMGEVNVLIRGRVRALAMLKDMLRQDVLKSRVLSSPPSLSWLMRWVAWLGI